MADIALGLKDLTRNEKKALARSLKTGLTGNANFPTPNPTTTQLEGFAHDVELAEADVSAAEGVLALKREVLRDKETALDDGLTASATNALNTTTDETKLRSGNYPIKGAATPVGILDAPANLHVSDGDTNFSADVQWDAVRRAKVYIVEIAEDENGPWTQKYIGSKSRCTIENLDPTKLYYVRVCTQSTAGMGRWGAAISFRVR